MPDQGLAGRTDPVPYKSAPYLQPDTVTRHLKWIYHGDTFSAGALNRLSFRVNSIYDPNMDITTASDNRRNSAFNGISAMLRDYQYYRVMANQVTVHFLRMYQSDELLGSDTAATTRLLRNQAAARNPVVCGVAIDPGDRWGSRWTSIGDWSQYKQAKYNDITFLQGEEAHETISFKYNPNEWNAGITIVEQEEIWTEIDKNPRRVDYFTVFTQGLGGDTTDFPNGAIKIVIEMDAVVQFREWSLQQRRDMYAHDRRSATNADTTFTPFQLGSNAAGDLTADLTRNTVDVQDQDDAIVVDGEDDEDP